MKNLFLVVISLSLFIACGNKQNSEKDSNEGNFKSQHYFGDCKKLFAEACYMDSILFSQTELDTVSAQKVIIAFTEFANYCQTDSLSPIFLIKTAQVARAINNIPQAKLVLDKCIADYPSFKSRPAALFLLAQLYDDNNYMNDENEAKRLYQKILDEYPDSEWAMSAKGAIAFIGKTDAQITNIILNRKK